MVLCPYHCHSIPHRQTNVIMLNIHVTFQGSLTTDTHGNWMCVVHGVTLIHTSIHMAHMLICIEMRLNTQHYEHRVLQCSSPSKPG